MTYKSPLTDVFDLETDLIYRWKLKSMSSIILHTNSFQKYVRISFVWVNRISFFKNFRCKLEKHSLQTWATPKLSWSGESRFWRIEGSISRTIFMGELRLYRRNTLLSHVCIRIFPVHKHKELWTLWCGYWLLYTAKAFWKWTYESLKGSISNTLRTKHKLEEIRTSPPPPPRSEYS